MLRLMLSMICAVTVATFGGRSATVTAQEAAASPESPPIADGDSAGARIGLYLKWLNDRDDLTLIQVERFLGFVEGESGVLLPPKWQASLVGDIIINETGKDRDKLRAEVESAPNAIRLGFAMNKTSINIEPHLYHPNADLGKTSHPYSIRRVAGEELIYDGNVRVMDSVNLLAAVNSEASTTHTLSRFANHCFVAVHNEPGVNLRLFKLTGDEGILEWEAKMHEARRSPAVLFSMRPRQLQVELSPSKTRIGVFYRTEAALSAEVIDVASGATVVRFDIFE